MSELNRRAFIILDVSAAGAPESGSIPAISKEVIDAEFGPVTISKNGGMITGIAVESFGSGYPKWA